MKNLISLLIAACIIISCQIEDDTSPSPSDSFIKYYGDLTGYEARDIEFLYDSSGFVVFGNVVSDDGTTSYAVLRMDLDGNLIDSTYFSLDIPIPGLDLNDDGEDDVLRGNNTAGQVQVFAEGYALIGTTLLNDNSAGVLNVSLATITFLDNNLNIGTFPGLQDQTILLTAGDLRNDGLDQFGSDIIRLDDGGILLLGSREIDRGGATDFDFYVAKRGGSNEFESIIGIPGDGQDDYLIRGFEKSNGNIVLIGYSSDESVLGENNGNNGTNVTFIELNSTGQILQSVSYGIAGTGNEVFNEVVSAAISTPSGFAITGTSNLSTEESYAFFMNLTKNGNLIAADTLSSAFRLSADGSSLSIESNGLGIAQGADNNFIILGQYPNFNYDVNIDNPLIQSESRAAEAMFMKVGQFGVPITGLESSYGSANGDDSAVDALAMSDGKIMVLANVDFGGGIQLVTLIKTNDTGKLED